jgi:hypothetical protein
MLVAGQVGVQRVQVIELRRERVSEMIVTLASVLADSESLHARKPIWQFSEFTE